MWSLLDNMQCITGNQSSSLTEVTAEWLNSLGIYATFHHKLDSCFVRPSCARVESVTPGPSWRACL